jgi:hypothetical protein
MSGPQPDQPDQWVRVRRSQLHAMHQAATTDHSDAEAAERAWGFRAGHAAGRGEGRKEALDEVARDADSDKRAIRDSVSAIEEEQLRWARPGKTYGSRDRFGERGDGEYAGGPVDFWRGHENEKPLGEDARLAAARARRETAERGEQRTRETFGQPHPRDFPGRERPREAEEREAG